MKPDEQWEQEAGRYADGEMAVAERREFEAQLASDPAAQRRWDVLRHDLQRIERALSPTSSPDEGLPARILERLAREPLPRPTAARRWPWLALPLAAAAGYIVAWLARPPAPAPRPPEKVIVYRDPPAGLVPLGRLALATGALEHRAPDTRRWEAAVPGAPIFAGSKLRTPAGRRAEITLADGSEIRLNQSSTLACVARRKLFLEQGELWSHVARAAGGEAFDVGTRHGAVRVVGTEINLAVDEAETRLVVLNGKALLRDRQGREVAVAERQASRIRDGRVFDPHRVHLLERTTNWTAELLYIKGRDHPELQRKVDNLLALIGATKMEHLTEREIRSLGHTCALPLARYIDAQSASGESVVQQRRRTAARILADVADAATLPDLVELIADPDTRVREQAARGFCRLWGVETQGRAGEIALWRDGTQAARERRRAELRRAVGQRSR